ncbi:coiled-coil domain-containing protein 39-like [Palaemon carinicauda]|uniref:coiled-coil domain-containing protein 39-like n=1 Tax=Palaemon carinicauda TaxID=392227 RepID=UPI0035B6A032
MAKWTTTLAGLKLLLLTVSVAGNDFVCPSEGIFRKSGSCNEYYYCIEHDWSLFVCPGSYLFDETRSECVPASTLTNPRECRKNPPINKHSRLRKVSTEDIGEKGNDAIDILAGYATGDFSDSGINEILERNTFEDSEIRGIAESPMVDSPAKAITEQLEGPVIENDGPLGSDKTITIHFMDHRNISNETVVVIVLEQQNVVSNVSSNATKDILSLCGHMNNAEAYFALVASSPLLHESLEYQRQYNKIIQQYNRDIKRAHNNTYLWRRGSSIPLGLKQSHKKAIEYEYNFKRKFAIFKEQIEIKASQKINPHVIQILESQIQYLTDRIRREQEVLDTTKVPALPKYLEESINFTKSEIIRLESYKNPNPEEIILRGLANFLGFVKNDAIQVESKVTQVLENIDTLLENIQIDALDYDKLSDETKTGFRTLHEEVEQIQNELKFDAKYQDKLDDSSKDLGELYYDLRNKESQIRKEIIEREENIDNFLAQKRIYCHNFGFMKNFINTNATEEEMLRACIHILENNSIPILDIDAEVTRLNELHRQMKMVQENQSEAMKELGSLITQRTGLSYTTPKNQRLREIEFELYNLQFHDAHLKNLQHGVTTARNSILILQREFQKLQKKFKFFVIKLQELIDAASAAINDDTQVGQRLFIENELEELQATLQNLVLNNINECPKTKS